MVFSIWIVGYSQEVGILLERKGENSPSYINMVQNFLCANKCFSIVAIA